MKATLKALKWIFGIILIGLIAGVAYVKFTLPDVGPAPALTIDKTDARIQRGEYLANHVTVCMDCHSTRDWTRFSGPVAAGNLGGGGEIFGHEMGFPGSFYSKNITPFNLQDWTDGELFRAITTGVSRDGKALFPVMPYVSYGRMDEEDIYSIIAYVRTLKSINSKTPKAEFDFPVNFLINTMPLKGEATLLPDSSDILKYGAYLVMSASCVDCHSKMDKGAKIPGTEFGGGMEFKLAEGVVRSANITPDMKTGIGNWTEEIFLSRFKMYADSSYVPQKVQSGEMNTTMPWTMYAGMTDYDLKAIFAYLKSLKPKNNKVEKFSKI